MVSDLRAELTGSVGATVPRYRMLLPPGWRSYDLSTDTERELVAAARARLSEAGRPDLAAALATILDQNTAPLAFLFVTVILFSFSLVGSGMFDDIANTVHAKLAA